MISLNPACPPPTSYLPPPSTPQVESDIAPYKGLLMGLFFMSVGMEISMQLFIEKV